VRALPRDVDVDDATVVGAERHPRGWSGGSRPQPRDVLGRGVAKLHQVEVAHRIGNCARAGGGVRPVAHGRQQPGEAFGVLGRGSLGGRPLRGVAPSPDHLEAASGIDSDATAALVDVLVVHADGVDADARPALQHRAHPPEPAQLPGAVQDDDDIAVEGNLAIAVPRLLPGLDQAPQLLRHRGPRLGRGGDPARRVAGLAGVHLRQPPDPPQVRPLAGAEHGKREVLRGPAGG
jgi:hypothetical protein